MKRGLKRTESGPHDVGHNDSPKTGPDEEGIETLGLVDGDKQANVRRQAPMKRGLKHAALVVVYVLRRTSSEDRPR